VRHLRNQLLAMSVATILVLSAFGVAMHTLTPVPVYAPNDGNIDTISTTDNDNTDNDNTDTISTTDNDNTDNDNTDNDNTDNDNTDNDNTDTISTTDNDNDILPFLIDVIECFTNNNEEFSDDVQLCLYDVIEVYFDDDDNTLSSNNADSDSNNNLGSNDDNDNNSTSLQET
jgi:hypothetical protein